METVSANNYQEGGNKKLRIELEVVERDLTGIMGGFAPSRCLWLEVIPVPLDIWFLFYSLMISNGSVFLHYSWD